MRIKCNGRIACVNPHCCSVMRATFAGRGSGAGLAHYRAMAHYRDIYKYLVLVPGMPTRYQVPGSTQVLVAQVPVLQVAIILGTR